METKALSSLQGGFNPFARARNTQLATGDAYLLEKIGAFDSQTGRVTPKCESTHPAKLSRARECSQAPACS